MSLFQLVLNLINRLPGEIRCIIKPKNRTEVIKANLYISMICKFIDMIISFIMVPITLTYLDTVRYGLWAALSSVIAWFFIFDIGIGNGLRNKFSECKAKGEILKAKYYVSSAYFYFAGLFILICIVFFIANKFWDWPAMLNAPAEMATELNNIVLVVFFGMSLNFILKLLSFILMADLRTATSDIFNVIIHVITLIGIILLSKYSTPSLLYYAILYMGTNVLVMLIASIFLFTTSYKAFRPNFTFINHSYGKELVKVGTKFFLLQTSAILLFQTTSFILSNLLGPEHVTDYNISFRYFTLVTVVFSMLANPLWSGYADAYHRNDILWITSTISKLRKLWLFIVTLLIIMLIIQPIVYKIWLNNKLSIDYGLSISMVAYLILSMWNTIYNPLLNATSKLKMQIVLSAIIPIIYIGLTIFFVKNIMMGAKGMMISLIITQALPMALLLPIHTKKIINKKAVGIWG